MSVDILVTLRVRKSGECPRAMSALAEAKAGQERLAKVPVLVVGNIASCLFKKGTL